MAEGAAELGGKGRGHFALAHHLRPCGIGDIQDLEPAPRAAEIGQVVVGSDIGEVDKAGIGVVALPAVPLFLTGLLCLIAEELAGIPPAPHLDRLRRIGNVDDAVNEILKPGCRGREVQITPAVVREAVDTSAAAVLGVACGPEGELFRMLGILLQRENVHTAGGRSKMLRCRAVQKFQAVAVGHDHQIVADLHLRRGHVGIDLRVHYRHVLDMARVGRVRHIKDLDTVAEEAAAVEVVFPLRRFIDLGLEEIVVITVVMSQHFHILDIAFVSRAFGVKPVAHHAEPPC